MHECKLCQRKETNEITDLRMICLGRDGVLYSGYYRPNTLTTEEKYRLGNGEHWIYTNRRRCLTLQLKTCLKEAI